MNTVTLNVEGMSCGHCQMAVIKALKSVSGVVDAQVDLNKKTATISYDATKTSLDALKTAVVEAGYEVS
jgi:copper chaperone